MSKAAKRKSRARRPPEPRGARTQVVPEAAPGQPTSVQTNVSTNEPPAPAERSIFPYVVSVLLLLPGVYWVLKDKTVWPYDQAWYAEVSVELWYSLIHHP